MKQRRHPITLALALSAVANGQAACSSSDQAQHASGGAIGFGGSSDSAGSTSAISGAPNAGSGATAANGGSGGTPATSAGSAGLGGSAALAGSAAVAGDAGAAAKAGAGGSAGGQGGSAGIAFLSDRVVVTGVRGTASPAAMATVQLHNAGVTAAVIGNVEISGANRALFRITSTTPFPASLGPGADLALTIEMTTSGAALPPAPSNKDQGSVLLSGTLTATLSSGAVSASVYGLVLTQANYEPTLGQILTTLGHPINVGKAQNNWNPNTSMDATTLPGIESGSDEVAASHFVKADAGNVKMLLVARFSPLGELPYGWYLTTTGCPAGCTTVGTMARISDVQTSDKGRMVYPPLKAGSATEFDPGTAPFGIWIYSDQKTQKFMEGGNAANGDWDYSQDEYNVPAKAHRFKSYPLKDAAGTIVSQSYLVAVEEAGNGDYQDYVFVLSNVRPMP
jgi:hypothetical protein